MSQTRDLDTMDAIMEQKDRDMARDGQPPLDPEHEALAEHKRFTFDVIAIPTDPLR